MNILALKLAKKCCNNRNCQISYWLLSYLYIPLLLCSENVHPYCIKDQKEKTIYDKIFPKVLETFQRTFGSKNSSNCDLRIVFLICDLNDLEP